MRTIIQVPQNNTQKSTGTPSISHRYLLSWDVASEAMAALGDKFGKQENCLCRYWNLREQADFGGVRRSERYFPIHKYMVDSWRLYEYEHLQSRLKSTQARRSRTGYFLIGWDLQSIRIDGISMSQPHRSHRSSRYARSSPAFTLIRSKIQLINLAPMCVWLDAFNYAKESICYH